MRSIGSPRCIVNANDHCGEGILWIAQEQSLYWVDNRRNLVHRHDLNTSSIQTWQFSETVASLARTSQEGVLCVVLGSRLLLWEPEIDRREPYGIPLPEWPDVRYNDSGVDGNGALWIGSMGNNLLADGTKREVPPERGSIFRLEPSGRWSRVLQGIGVSNTLVWNVEETRFYTADSLLNTVTSYRYDPTQSTLDSPQPFFVDFSRGKPDGSAIDEEGSLWNCRYGGACVVRISPSGAVQRVVELPVRNVTSCTFGGADLQTLYVTTAASDIDGKPLDGGIFAIETGVKGKPLRAHLVDAFPPSPSLA